jgi:hypothetical protein
MTWRIKVQGVAFALGVVGALAVSSGANWVEWIFRWL